MKRLGLPPFVILALLFLVGSFSTALAAITPVGNVLPSTPPPSEWTSYTTGYVGDSGAGTLTVNGGSTLHSLRCYVGDDSGASGLVTVSGGTWSNSNEIYVGCYGSGTLSIASGGSVSSAYGYLGSLTGSTGAVTVDGSSARWSNHYDLNVGRYGSGILNIINHGSVRCPYGYGRAYLGYSSGSSGTVSVNDSTWVQNNDITIGYSGSGTLLISNGGYVYGFNGYVGDNYGSSGTVTVDGLTSRWINTQNLDVGDGGNGRLNILNRSTVSVASITTLGSAGVIDFGSNGGTLTTAMLFASPTQLLGTGVISTKGLLSDFNLTFDASGSCSVAFGTGGTATVNMSATTGNGDLRGYASTGTMTIENGANVYSANAFLGYNTGSSGTATVDGSGSKWINAGSLYVGRLGNGTLNITNQGSVSVAGTTTVGPASFINFGDGGGTLTTDTLYASPSQLMGAGTIIAKGLVSDFNLTFDGSGIASVPFGTGGTATVDMHVTTGSNDLGAGFAGTGTVIVRNQAIIYGKHGYLGYNSASSGTATVDGAGSKWNNTGNLYVGHHGNGTLHVTNGGTVSNSNGYLGYNSGGFGSGTVDGPGSKWTNSSSLYVGHYGRGALNIANGGTVSSYTGRIGEFSGSTGTVTVDGAGSTWTNTTDLYVGNQGIGRLNIFNNSAVSVAGTTFLGSGSSINFGGSGGTLTTRAIMASLNQLTGTGTIIAKGLVGDIDLSFDASAIASVPFGAGGTMTVDMSDSIVSGDLGVGYASTALLTIRNGAIVNSSSGFLGYKAASSGTATVDGPDSTWSNLNSIIVGHYGDGTLNIINGGTVQSNSQLNDNYMTSLGLNAGSRGMVTVDGPGSTWTGGSSRYSIGSSGGGTLSIANGGVVSWPNITLGLMSGSTGVVNLNGGTLIVNMIDAGSGTAAFNFGGGTFQISDSVVQGFGTKMPMTLTGIGGNANIDTNGKNASLFGLLSGVGGLNKLGAGTLTLGPNTYTGPTTVSGGVLNYGGNNAISTGSVTVSGGTLNLGTFSDSVGAVTLAGGAITGGMLTSTSGFDMQSGTVSSNLLGAVGLTKTTAGTVFLSGVNTFSGTTTVGAGILLAARPASLPGNNASGSISVASGAAVGGYVAASGYWTEANFTMLRTNANWIPGAALAIDTTPGSYTYLSAINDGGSVGTVSIGLTKTGPNTLTLSGANAYTGRTTIAASGGTASTLILGPTAQAPVLAGGGADIQAGKMIFQSCGTATVNQIKTLLTESCNGGQWNTGQFLCTTSVVDDLTLGWKDDLASGSNYDVTVRYTYAGDFDLSGEVDGADLGIWKLNIANPLATWKLGNANYDDAIDGRDLEIWKANFGKMIADLVVDGPSVGGLNGSGATVPEPGTLVMILAVALGLSLYLLRRKRSLGPLDLR